MKVILYPRVSSIEQLKGDSIDAQIKRLKQHSEENNDEVVGIYTDAGKSASVSEDKMTINFKKGKFIIGIDLKKRPAMKKIIEEISLKKFDAIKFTKWDRFCRNVILSKILQIYFESHNVKLIPTDDSTDPLMVEIRGALSEEEIRKMKERVRTTRLNRFEKGIMVGRSPLAYKWSKTKKMMIVDPKKSEMIKDIFKMAIEKKSYKEICEKYKLKPQSYYNIIRNPVYCGYIEFEGKKKKGIHLPIIFEEDFNRINRQ